MRTATVDLDGAEGALVEPLGEGNGTGVLVLSGTSGCIERSRATVLSTAGVAALTYRWATLDAATEVSWRRARGGRGARARAGFPREHSSTNHGRAAPPQTPPFTPG